MLARKDAQHRATQCKSSLGSKGLALTETVPRCLVISMDKFYL